VDRFDVEQTYACAAAAYDQEAPRDSGSLTAVEEVVVLSLLRRLRFHDVLDAGTGTGRHALRLAQMGKRVVGIDLCEPMLEVARAKARELGLDVEFRRASVLAVPEADESFDLVLSALALAHVEDLAGATRELVRVLRPGGHLIISDLHPDIQKQWGTGCTAAVKDGRLVIGDYAQGLEGTLQSPQLPFPQYHGSVDEYVDGIEAAGAEVLAAIDVPMEQIRGLFPGPLVVLARKREQG